MGNRKGDRNERNLVDGLLDYDIGAIRIPASGGGTDRDLPDVLAGRAAQLSATVEIPTATSKVWAFEAKSSSGDPIYVDGSEVEDLYRFAALWNAEPRLAVRFDLKPGDPMHGADTDVEPFYFVDPENCYRTDAGTYRVKKSDVTDPDPDAENGLDPKTIPDLAP